MRSTRKEKYPKVSNSKESTIQVDKETYDFMESYIEELESTNEMLEDRVNLQFIIIISAIILILALIAFIIRNVFLI